MKCKVVFVLLLICGFTLLTHGVNAYANTTFHYPLKGDWSPIQDFGVWNPDWKGYHLAEDILRDANTAVYPIGDGVVKYANTVLGYTVIIEHELPPGDPAGNAVCSVYYHLKRPEDGGISLTAGTPVSMEDPMGYVSGRWEDHQSVPHLHFGIRKGNYQTGTDPRTERWYYPGYTTIYKKGVRQDNPSDPTHQQILSEWFNPTTDPVNGVGFIDSRPPITFRPFLQGRDVTDETFTLIILASGTQTEVTSFTTTPDPVTGILSIPQGIETPPLPGTYDILIHSPGYLWRKMTNAYLSAGSTIDLPELLAGDLNNDNIINSIDWSIMSTKWFTSNPVPDINRDGIVNSIDFSWMNMNWFKEGD